MGRAMHAIGAFSARRPVVVIVLWALMVVGVSLFVRAVGAQTNNDLSLPGTDSQAATDLLEAEFPPQQNGSSSVVFHTPTGKVDDGGTNQKAIEAAYKAISGLPHVYSATDPFAQPQAGLVSKDSRYAFIPVVLDVDAGQLDVDTAQRIADAATAPAEKAGMATAVSGPIGNALSHTSTESSEVIGLIAAMLILTFTFGSLVAMGMPILTAVVGLSTGLGLVGLLGHLVNIPSVGATLATMIGLGVGIDYALFLVTRHLEQRHEGMGNRDSVARAVATSGSAIVFAGGTVVIALLALAVAGIPFVTALGWACAVAVLTAVVAAVTLLPALLSVVGDGIHRLALPAFLRPRPKPAGAGVWERWAGLVTRHPVASLLVALAIMLPLIIPVFSLRLGQDDTAAAPPATTKRQAFDMLTAGYGPGYNGALLVAASLDPVATPSEEYDEQYAEANALKSDLEEQQKTLTAQANALTAQQKQLEQEQSSLERQKAKLQKQAKALSRQKAQLEREQARLEAQQRALQDEVADLKAEARRLAEREVALTRKIVALDARIVALRAAIAAATDPVVIAALQRDLAARQAERAALVATRKATTKQLRAVGKQARTIPGKKAALEQQADDLRNQSIGLQREADSLESQAAQLQREAAALTKQAAALQKQADELKQQQADAEAEQTQAEQLQSSLTDMLTQAGGDARGTDPRVVELQDALSTPIGVLLVSPPKINDAGTAMTFTVIATTRPADPATATLVVAEREVIAPATEGSGIVAHVGGSTAGNVDLASLITEKLPLVILTVLALSFVLLLVAFRSLLVPLQAAVMNLISVGAAFGILTAAFQWGWAIPYIGPDTAYGTVPIPSYVPLMMFAALFGLSMDYEVFLVSHIQGRHMAGDEAGEAVRSGLASSGKVIVAAAAIMISVFGSFILSADPTIKQFGVGLASAVFLAALMVMLFAPALLVLFGETTWKLPRFLDRILPHMDLEGHGAAAAAAEAAADGPAEVDPTDDVALTEESAQPSD